MKDNKEDPNFIRIEKLQGQKFLKFIKKEFKQKIIIDPMKKVLTENEYLLFPLMNNAHLINELVNNIKDEIDFELIFKEAILNPKYKYRSLQEALNGLIPDNYYEYVPKSFDIIGNIAILEFDKEISLEKNDLIDFKLKIAKVLLDLNKNLNAVYEKASEIKGEYRLRDLIFLYGKNKTETIHKENNCIFKLDIKRTFFTPRLVYERKRITSSNIKKNELIVDLFAGVGPFSIQIAKLHNIKIHSFDVNIDAYNYLKENIKLNKLKGEIIPYNMDIRTLLDPRNNIGNSLAHAVDRVIMNLPERALNFLDIACFLMKKEGGILHFYQFYDKSHPLEKAEDNLKIKLKKLNLKIERILEKKSVKPFSPKSNLIVSDLLIKYL